MTAVNGAPAPGTDLDALAALEWGEPVLGPLTGHDGFVFAVAVGERLGRPVIVSGSGETVRVWDLESGEPVLGRLSYTPARLG